jgi:hypothetical protein
VQRHFFGVTNGDQLVDPSGMNCAGDKEAIAFADFIALQIAVEAPSAVRRSVTVRDSAGQAIGEVPIPRRLSGERLSG